MAATAKGSFTLFVRLCCDHFLSMLQTKAQLEQRHQLGSSCSKGSPWAGSCCWFFFSKICCSQGWLAASSELLHIRAVLLSLLQRSEGRGLYSCTAKGSSIYFIHKHVRPTLCPEMHQQSAGRSEQSFWAAQEEMELWLKAEAGPPSSTLANSSPLVCHTLCLGGDRVRGEADSRRALGLRGVQVTWQSFGEAF